MSNIPVEYLADPRHALCRFNPPFDETLRKLLLEETRSVIRGEATLSDINVIDGGVVLQSRFGRFETVAEIDGYRREGADLVTHNLTTEIVFARQLGIHFASLNVISNPAEGVAPWTLDSLTDVYRRLNPVSWKILEGLLPRIAAIPTDQERTLVGQREHPPLSCLDAITDEK